MGYSNPEYQARYEVPLALNTSLGTFTASGSNALTSVLGGALPKFIRRTRLNKLRFVCRTIPNASATGLTAIVLNGTTTVGTAVLTTATANQNIDLTITGTTGVNVYSRDTAPTINIVGTATASGGALGAYDLYAEAQEQPE
jgi:hypothetical protein